jgi:DNA-binding NarL/FixJ family response regulator
MQREQEKLYDFITITKEFARLSLLILTNQLTNAEVHRLLISGINNIALKTDKKDDLLYSVEMALKHRRHFSDDILEMILEMNNGKIVPTETHDIISTGQDAARLTSSEQDIVKLIAEGFTTKQIASRKNISFHTVMTHRKNIFRKLSINSVSDLTRYAIRKGLIDNIEYNI